MKKQLLAVTALAGLMVSSASMATMNTDLWLGSNAVTGAEFSSYTLIDNNPSPVIFSYANTYTDVTTNSIGLEFGAMWSNTLTGPYEAWYGASADDANTAAVETFDLSAFDDLHVLVTNSGNANVASPNADFSIFVKTVGGTYNYGTAALGVAANGEAQLTFDIEAAGFDRSAVESFGIYMKTDHNIQHALAVPEPSTALLLGAGLMGLGFAARRKSKKSA